MWISSLPHRQESGPLPGQVARPAHWAPRACQVLLERREVGYARRGEWQHGGGDRRGGSRKLASCLAAFQLLLSAQDGAVPTQVATCLGAAALPAADTFGGLLQRCRRAEVYSAIAKMPRRRRSGHARLSLAELPSVFRAGRDTADQRVRG